MNDEMRRLLKKEMKRSGKNIGELNAKLNKAEYEAKKAADKAERDARNLRINAEKDHFAKLLQGIRVKPSFDVQIANAFKPLDGTPPITDDGYIAIIGVTPEQVVFGGSQYSYMKKQGGDQNVGTWRNGSNIQSLTHISIFGYRKVGIEDSEHLEAMLKLANQINPFGIGAKVRVFDNNGKTHYDSLDELKADIALVLSKIYKLPIP